jgi:large conductance mechanosensitive channel
VTGILSGFKSFVVKGNLIELAVAFVIGAAFAALVQALVEDLVTPLVAAVFGEPSFGNLSFEVNESMLFYGDFLNAMITLLSVSAAIYFFVVVRY